jgi:DNA repair exonuclease SbcCD nuclease subunit
MIRFLQISDIHFSNTAGVDDDFRLMKRRFLEDIAKCRREMGKIDYILICGDVAFSGIESQYKEAKEFIKLICEKTECSSEQLFVVPGNHDKRRDVYSKTRMIMRDALLKGKSTKQLLISKVREPMAVGVLYVPFKQFYLFASEYSSISDVAQKSLFFPEADQDKGIVPKFEPEDAFYWTEQIGEMEGMPLYLHGCNSALLSDKDDGESCNLKESEGEHLQVLPLQMYNISPAENEIHIIMLHHPMSEVYNGKTITTELDSRFRLQLFGHVHKQSSSSENAVHIYSGALQPPEADDNKEYFPVYNVIELDVEGEDKALWLKVDIYSRKWDGGKFDEYMEETKVGDKALRLKLPHNNAWEKTMATIKKVKKEDEILEETKTEVYPHVIKHRFLQCGKEGKVIKAMYGDKFDKISPNRLKYLEFLKQVEIDDRINELNDILTRNGK